MKIKNKLFIKALNNKTNLVNLNYYKYYKNILGFLKGHSEYLYNSNKLISSRYNIQNT